MRTHQLSQGTPEWKAHRPKYRNASDAPVVLGCSPYKTRSQLLHELSTGIEPEIDAATQRLFDDGHRFEALACPLAEEIIGEPLYPVVGTEGKFGASFDGLTIGEDTGFEHKSLNEELRAVMTSECAGADLPKMYRVQMEQQCMVSGADRILFMASKWNGEELVEERHCWYYPDAELRAEIIAGWAQFEQDLAAYVPPPAAVPAVVAAPVQALPAVLVQVTGEIAIKDNFKAFETALRDFLEHRLIREPKTDQDFADLDLQIKAMKGAEVALDGAEAQMLAQIQAVDTAKKAKDMLAKLVRDNRLMAEKLLASEKERRRAEIVTAGITALREHCAALTERLGKPYLPTIAADFAGAIKGMRSLASMEDAIATTLANAKIEANAVADRIQTNLTKLREQAAQHAFLFADTAQIVLKAPEDCQAVITARIAEHAAAEEKRLAAEREKIAAEERAKAEAKVRAEQEAATAAERQKASDEAAQQKHQETPSPVPAAAPAVTYPPLTAERAGLSMASPPVDTGATLKMGDICARLGFSVNSEFLANLGFKPKEGERAAKLYREADFPAICMAIARHVEAIANAPAK